MPVPASGSEVRDSVVGWATCTRLAVVGVRSAEVESKIRTRLAEMFSGGKVRP